MTINVIYGQCEEEYSTVGILTDLSEETILQALKAMLIANRPTAPIYLRPFVYTSDLGIAPRLHDIETDFFIFSSETLVDLTDTFLLFF